MDREAGPRRTGPLRKGRPFRSREGRMVDRVYKAELPQVRKELLELRREFSRSKATTNWVGLRIDPLLRHAKSLEALLGDRRFAKEFSRLRRGVPMFHSDLVYFRDNVKGLRLALVAEVKHGRPARGRR